MKPGTVACSTDGVEMVVAHAVGNNRSERTSMICAPGKLLGTKSAGRRGLPGTALLVTVVSVFSLLTLLFTSGVANAQETTGRIMGRVTDMSTGQALSGMTVILQGDQGEDAALTDDRGEYTFVNLHVGTYVVRFYNANSATNVERPDVTVSAGATIRADAAIPTQAAVAETYVIKRKAAAVDVGSARLGLTIGEDYMQNVPAQRTFGDLILRAPGAFLESSGSASIAGASGLENVYIMNGLNVTGMEYGDIMNGRSDASGGSNLTLDFIKEMQINTGGYTAEFGGAMGGVVNVVTKSGSNEIHGSAFMYWSPYWLSGDPKLILKTGSALNGVDKPDYDTNIGFELGGPIIKNKLFFWVGFAPRFEKQHFFRDVTALSDADHDGAADLDANGKPITTFLLRTRTRELRQSYQAGGKIDWLIAPNHTLTLGAFVTPTASRHVRTITLGGEAVNDPRWADQSLHKTNTDLNATWVGQFLDRRLRFDVSGGWHREDFSDQSPYSELNATNQMEWHNASLYNLEGIAGCELQPYTDKSGAQQKFDPCPVDNYHNGGYGLVKQFVGNRYSADAKATFLVNRNELKAGLHTEFNTFDQTRYYSGPPGSRVLNIHKPGESDVLNFFSLPQGSYPYQFGGDNFPKLTQSPYAQDQLVANVKGVNTALFIQDTVRPVSNFTADFGIRFENQRLYDFRGDEFLNLYNIGPRAGVIYDPSNEGRSKIYTHYGRFFETIPMNLAARYFGGEGIAFTAYNPTQCAVPPQNWNGTGGQEWKNCGPPLGGFAANAGANYPVQPNIKGQYHDEIVAGFRHALTDDLVVGLDYTHRWLGGVIEDGTVTGDSVLGNPGHVSGDVLDGLKNDISAKEKEVAAARAGSEAQKKSQADLGLLQSKLTNLAGLGAEPKPERTYDAVTLSATKRFARRWMFNGSYTYSRLIGNYNGLYDADNSYFAPNGGNAYDYPELVINKRGPLANDRPHSGRVDGFYEVPVGKGSFVGGLSFSAYSGVPRNYIGALIPSYQLVFILPRGSAGRTPTVTQADVKLAYRRPLSKTTALEAFLDIYNVLNQRTALQMDDNYTSDVVSPIENGTVNDLRFARNIDGTPLSKNPNFGQPTVYQTPIHGRLGLRLLF
ncbi:MAG: carboxypeptidase regulatory-like domain-containing protein [Myxococcales bacterium]